MDIHPANVTEQLSLLPSTDSEYVKVLCSLPQSYIDHFIQAVRSGSWPDGQRLTLQQRDICQEAVMLRAMIFQSF